MENEICRLDIIWALQLNFWSHKKRKLDFLLNFERGSIVYIEIWDAKHFELDNLHCSWDPRSTNLMLQHKAELTPEKSNGGIICLFFLELPQCSLLRVWVSTLLAQGKRIALGFCFANKADGCWRTRSLIVQGLLNFLFESFTIIKWCS